MHKHLKPIRSFFGQPNPGVYKVAIYGNYNKMNTSQMKIAELHGELHRRPSYSMVTLLSLRYIQPANCITLQRNDLCSMSYKTMSFSQHFKQCYYLTM